MKHPQKHCTHSLREVARYAKIALDAIIPRINPDWPSFVPIVVVAAQVEQYITDEEWIREDALYNICVLIMHAWKQRLFTPCDDYPYTFEQTLEDWNSCD